MNENRYISAQQAQKPLPIDVISIQSQVVYGHVGNSAAVPTLEAQGLAVASVPTVLFSNSPLYPTLYGGIIPDTWFEGYLEALLDRHALNHTRAIMLGYLGSPSQAQILETWLKKVRETYLHLLIQIDPVLGDIGAGLYVDPALASVYRDSLHLYATGMTPNHFELEYLTGQSIHNIEEATEAAKSLLSDTTQWIIATSIAPQTWAKGMMELAIITHDDVEIQQHAFFQTDAQGTGDVFAAMLVSGLIKGKTLSVAAREAATFVMETVRNTAQQGTNELLFQR